MITLIDTQHTKTSDKIQHLLIIKTLGILGVEENFFDPIKNTLNVFCTKTVQLTLY